MRLDRNKLTASILQDDYEEFVKHFWFHVVGDNDLVWNWHMTEICQLLQRKALRVIQGLPNEGDALINVCPGSSKSLLTSVLFVGWVWANNPAMRFICGSFAKELSLALSVKCRKLIQCAEYQKLFPHVVLSPDQNEKSLFSTTRGGERIACSSGGNILGRHAHFIILDDPMDPKQARSDADRTAINNWIDEEINKRKINKIVTTTFLIMQRLHQDDPAGRMLEREKNGIPIEKLIIPATTEGDIYPPQLEKHYRKEKRSDSYALMDLKRLPNSVLNKERTLDSWPGQFLQSPVPAGGSQFVIAKFNQQAPYPVPIQWVRSWDKAGSTKKHSAWTVGVKMGVDAIGRILVTDVIRVKMNSHERNELIYQTAEQDGLECAVAIEQEPGSGGLESAQTSVQQLRGWKVVLFKPTDNKEVRADAWSSQVNAGNVWLAPAPWNQEFLTEHKFFPVGTWKDQVDACSQGNLALSRKMIVKVGTLKTHTVKTKRRAITAVT